MKTTVFAPLSLLFLVSAVLAVEVIDIGPLDTVTPKPLSSAKAIEKVSLSGSLRTIPLSGVKLTLQSRNRGQVILFSPLALEATTRKRLETLEKKDVHVKVTGTLVTLCTAEQLVQNEERHGDQLLSQLAAH